jgi:hypothetical protein
MAVPSSVALGGLALVVTAGVGLAAVTAYAQKDEKAPAAAGPSAAPTSTPTPTPVKPKKQKSRKDVEVVPETLVVVYNNSGISGLAADKAAELQGAGWKVAGADNWYGNIPADTVYFPPGHKAEAEQLAKTLRIDRIKPAVAPMQFDRLTVIFTGS